MALVLCLVYQYQPQKKRGSFGPLRSFQTLVVILDASKTSTLCLVSSLHTLSGRRMMSLSCVSEKTINQVLSEG